MKHFLLTGLLTIFAVAEMDQALAGGKILNIKEAELTHFEFQKGYALSEDNIKNAKVVVDQKNSKVVLEFIVKLDCPVGKRCMKTHITQRLEVNLVSTAPTSCGRVYYGETNLMPVDGAFEAITVEDNFKGVCDTAETVVRYTQSYLARGIKGAPLVTYKNYFEGERFQYVLRR